MASKRKAEITHAINRGKERYGLTLSKQDIKNISRIIREGESEFLEKSSNTATIHRLVYKDVPMVVVYDKVRKTIRTILPEDCKENDR